ncbi:hypothetical protein [Clostridium sp.]|jgi:hypothetical protein|uniref:hypothetical protein n=1 Tax=Clostridium sp. TaxID=1506 RepID=UPI003EED1BAC
MLKSIIKVSDKVRYLLTNYPVFRDDDNKLIAKIWYSETRSKDLRDFLIEFGDKNISSPEAIRRARQKIQEHDPSLRGKLYNKRHKNGLTVKTHIKFLNS